MITADAFTQAPTVEHKEKLKGGDGVMVDHTVQSSFSNEPIFGVGNEQLQGYMSYKVYDVYSGHVINNSDVENRILANNVSTTQSTYTLEKSGKRFASGKTYYLGYASIAVPKYDAQ